MFQFNKRYFLLALLLFVVEVLIALYVHDAIVRPYIGDVLVVILLYCFVRSFFRTSVVQTAIAVLLFSYLIETLQYFQIGHRLGLEHSPVAMTIIGNYFQWIDLVAYTFGIAIVLFIETRRAGNRARRQAGAINH
jgi:hypothetical protein